MRRLRDVLLVVVMAGLVAGCNRAVETRDTSQNAEVESPSATPSEAHTEEAIFGEGVGRPVLTNSEGLTLYYFRNDEPGKSNCNDPCSDTWPPVPADEPINTGELDPARLGSVTRDDGAEQLAYDEMPLYLFKDDKAPGEVKGQGLSNVWFAVAADGSEIGPKEGVRIGSTDAGDALIDPEGFTIYTFDDDRDGGSNCNNQCAETWVPVPGDTPISSGVAGSQFSTLTREDGSMQLMLDRHPLYRYVEDENPGDAKGAGVGDVWSAVPASDVQVADESGNEITVGHTDLGPTLVNGEGMTLYAFTNDAYVNEAEGQSNCNDSCAEVWPPVPGDVAVDDSLVTGQTRTVIRVDGSAQLAIGEWPLYTSSRDAAPGDVNGQGSGGSWFAVAPDGSLYED